MQTLEEKLAAFNSELPLDHAQTIPSQWYFDSEIFQAELREVFGGSWQLFARQEQLTEKGSYLNKIIGKERVIVVRNQDNQLKAFFNVCRHKAASVVSKDCGTVSKFRCRYHGWTYNLDGQLIGTPEFDGVAGFCRKEQGLLPIAVDTWGPFVFVNLSVNPQPLSQYLGKLAAQTDASMLERYQYAGTKHYDLECNWKVFVDNYLDGGYHVNTVHPSLSKVLQYVNYQTINDGNTSVQVSPMKPVAEAADQATQEVRSGDKAFYWWVFPNLMLNLYDGLMDTNLVVPLAENRCRIYFDYFFSHEKLGLAEKSIEVAHKIQMEDEGVCQEVQAGLQSRAYDTGRFSVRRESGEYHFHKLLAQSLKRATVV